MHISTIPLYISEYCNVLCIMVVEGVDVLSLVVDGAIEGICNIWRKKTYNEVCGCGTWWTELPQTNFNDSVV